MHLTWIQQAVMTAVIQSKIMEDALGRLRLCADLIDNDVLIDISFDLYAEGGSGEVGPTL